LGSSQILGFALCLYSFSCNSKQTTILGITAVQLHLPDYKNAVLKVKNSKDRRFPEQKLYILNLTKT